MALRADDLEAADFDDPVVLGLPLLGRALIGLAAEHDVGAAAGHVGGDGDGGVAARLRDDAGFLLVLLGVQHAVLDALARMALLVLLAAAAGARLVAADLLRGDDGAAAAFGGLIGAEVLRRRLDAGRGGEGALGALVLRQADGRGLLGDVAVRRFGDAGL